MIGLSTQRAPSPSVVVPHFAFGAISFLVLAVLLLFSGEDMMGHYFNGKILAITHIATLAWATMIIFGSLYQLIPVIMEVALHSEILAKIGFYIFALGILGFVPAFWMGSFGVALLAPATFLLLAISLFTYNVLRTAFNAPKRSIQAIFIINAVFWLLLTAVFGFLITLNFTVPFLSVSHLTFLKIHAHLGLVGWFVMLIIGAAGVLIPMFLLSHQLNENRLRYALYLINAGLLLISLDWYLFQMSFLFIIFSLLIVCGIFLFILFAYEAYKKRARKNLDIGLKHTAVAILVVFLPLLLALFLSLNLNMGSDFISRMAILYGASIMLGFVSSLIFGQTYKTLPFIVWLARYQPYVGKKKTPLPKDLYSEKLLTWQYYSYLLAIVLLFLGILFGAIWVIRAGSMVLLVSAVFYNWNIFKMITHKTQLSDLKTIKR